MSDGTRLDARAVAVDVDKYVALVPRGFAVDLDFREPLPDDLAGAQVVEEEPCVLAGDVDGDSVCNAAFCGFNVLRGGV